MYKIFVSDVMAPHWGVHRLTDVGRDVGRVSVIDQELMPLNTDIKT